MLRLFFEEIAQETDKYCYSVNETINALEMGAIETLIIWDNSDITRIVTKHPDGQESVVYLTPLQETNSPKLHDQSTGLKHDVVSRENVIEWLINNYKSFGIKLVFVTNRTHEGGQFCNGFGGIGGLLRWKLDIAELDCYEDDIEDDIDVYDDLM